MATPRDTSAQGWYNLDFIVYDGASGARIGGARVTIDADFGNGWERYTDGGGYTNFGVYSDEFSARIGWRVEANGYHAVTGSVYVNDHRTVWVGMETTSPPPGQNGVGSPMYFSTGDGQLMVLPFESNWDSSTAEMYTEWTAPTGRYARSACLRFWVDHPEWGPEVLNCSWEAHAAFAFFVDRFWEDDYAWWWAPYTGTVGSAYWDYVNGQQVRLPGPGEPNPMEKQWRGAYCWDQSAIDQRFKEAHIYAARVAVLAAAGAAIPCIGATWGWQICVTATGYAALLGEMALAYWEYKDACAY